MAMACNRLAPCSWNTPPLFASNILESCMLVSMGVPLSKAPAAKGLFAFTFASATTSLNIKSNRREEIKPTSPGKPPTCQSYPSLSGILPAY